MVNSRGLKGLRVIRQLFLRGDIYPQNLMLTKICYFSVRHVHKANCSGLGTDWKNPILTLPSFRNANYVFRAIQAELEFEGIEGKWGVVFWDGYLPSNPNVHKSVSIFLSDTLIKSTVV